MDILFPTWRTCTALIVSRGHAASYWTVHTQDTGFKLLLSGRRLRLLRSQTKRLTTTIIIHNNTHALLLLLNKVTVLCCVALCCVMLCHVVCSANLGQYSSFIVLFYYVWLCNDNKEFSCHLSYIFSSTLILCVSQVAERERAEEIITSEGEWKQKYNSVLSHIVLVINQVVHCHLSFVYMSINCYMFSFFRYSYLPLLCGHKYI